MHELEQTTLGRCAAGERSRLDQQQFVHAQKKNFAETQRRKQAELASEVAAGV